MRAARKFTVFCLLVSSVFSVAQDTSVRRGTRIPAELSRTIKTSSAKVGDRVTFRTIQPVLVSDGVVVPVGSELRGLIEELKRGQSAEATEMRIRLDTLIYRQKEIPVNLVVSSLYYARASSMPDYDKGRLKLTFLEDIQVTANMSAEASTSFRSERSFVLRNGILLEFRQVDPKEFQNRQDQVAATLEDNKGGSGKMTERYK